ncbi:MAG TPA: sulfotransferase, partial [Candidatus Berkiella sp.]|nr:sulfotransferase [Candidatus Berkiella sp.]
MRHLTQNQVNLLRESYYHRLTRDNVKSPRYLIDTMPNHFLYLGLMKVLFPKARFIFCQRDPLDNGVALYFKYFIQGHAYSVDMKKIASYYQQHMLLMNYWLKVFSDEILTVKYEDLVKKPENTLSTIISFLDCDEYKDIDYSHIHEKEVGIYQLYRHQFTTLATALDEPVGVSQTPDEHDVLIKENMRNAYLYFNRGDLEAAKMLCQTLLLEEPNYYAAYHLLGIIHSHLGDEKIAVLQLRKALENAPLNLQVHLDLAAVLKKNGNLSEAKQIYQKSEKLKSGKNLMKEKGFHDLLLNAFSSAPNIIEKSSNQLLVQSKISTEKATELMTSLSCQHFNELCQGHLHYVND